MTNKMVVDILVRYHTEKKEVTYLDEQIKALKSLEITTMMQLEENRFSAVADIRSVPFGCDRIQTSYSGSAQENAIENVHDILFRQLKDVKNEIKLLGYQKLVLLGFINVIEPILTCLSDSDKYIIELKYFKRQSNIVIADTLCMSESKLKRENSNVINKIRHRLEKNYFFSHNTSIFHNIS